MFTLLLHEGKPIELSNLLSHCIKQQIDLKLITIFKAPAVSQE